MIAQFGGSHINGKKIAKRAGRSHKSDLCKASSLKQCNVKPKLVGEQAIPVCCEQEECDAGCTVDLLKLWSCESGPIDTSRRLLSRPGPQKLRAPCVAVILELVRAYGVGEETAAYAIILYDRFLCDRLGLVPHMSDELVGNILGGNGPAIRGVSLSETAMIRNAAVACFLLATKYKETSSACLLDLSRLMGGRCSVDQVLPLTTCFAACLTGCLTRFDLPR